WVRLAMNESRDYGGACYGDSGGPNFVTGGGLVAQVRTESGLPVRVRQASLAPELRDEPAAGDDDEDTVRPPEQVRRMMSSYQSGTRRGRTDAARLLGGAGGGRPETGEEAGAGEGPDVGDQQAT
ncbi:hypothetical protein ABT351_33515, partial [Micromonospora sp. NPDC000018]